MSFNDLFHCLLTDVDEEVGDVFEPHTKQRNKHKVASVKSSWEPSVLELSDSDPDSPVITAMYVK